MTDDVVRVEGVINGSRIVFYQEGDSDIWQAEIPSVPDGIYVTELYAWDKWGNRTYYAKVLFYADHKCLHMRFLDSDLHMEEGCCGG